MTGILHDVFPATVALTAADFPTAVGDLRSQPPTPGAAALGTTRVVVTSDRIIIAQDKGTGPVVVFSEGIDPNFLYKAASPRNQDSYVTTLSGKKIAYRKDSSCGCGSRLKSWRPFKTMGSVKDPTE